MSGVALRVLVGAVWVASVVACGSGGATGDAGTTDLADTVDAGPDGIDTDTGPVGPSWEAEVVDGGLAWADPTALDLTTYARRTHAFGVQAVLAVNALVFLDAAKTPRETATARLTAARQAADLADTAAQALLAATAAARPAAKADGPGAAVEAEGPVPLAFMRRGEAVLDGLEEVAAAVAGEAQRIKAALDGVEIALPLDPAQTQVALDAARTELATAPGLAVALSGGVVAAGRAASSGPGFPTRGLVTVVGAEAAAVQAGDVVVLAAAPSLPLTGGPTDGAVLLRTGAGAGEVADVPVWLAPVAEDSPAGVELVVSFTAAEAATVVSTELSAGAPCQATGDACALDPGAFPPGDYLGPGGVAFASGGLAGSVVGLLQAALPAHERVIDLGTSGPPPVLTKLAPERGPVGTQVTLTGSGFGTDLGRVTISMNHGRLVHPKPTSVTDGAVSFSVPTGEVAGIPYGYCSYNGEQAGLTWLTVGGVETSSTYFTLTGLPACPPAPFSVNPVGGVPGVKVRVEGYGFSPTAELNRVQVGPTALLAESYEPDAFGEPDRGTITFHIPGEAEPGTLKLRFQRVDGVSAWSSDLDFTVLSADLVSVGPGELAGGLVLPGRCWDVGLPSQGCVGAQTDWLLSGTNLHAIVGEGTKKVGQLEAVVETAAGSFTTRAYAPTPTVLMVQGVEAEWFAGLGPGDTVAIRVRGREPSTYAEILSAPVTVPVVGAWAPGAWRTLSSTLEADPTVGPAVVVPRGDLLVVSALYKAAEVQELMAPGLWDGVLRVRGSCAYVEGLCDDLAVAGTPMARHVPLTSAGTYTVTNMTTGKSVDIEVRAEGFYGGTVWPSISVEEGPQPKALDAASAGVMMGCGGMRVEVPPGALPLHDGSGAYRVLCWTSYADTSPGLPQLTDGGWNRSLTFDPEPTQLLKPIRLTIPFGVDGRTTEPDAGLVDPASGLYFTLPAQVDADKGELTLVVPGGSWPAPTATFLLAPSGPASASKWPSLGLNTLLGKVAAISWKSNKGTLTDETRALQVNYVSDTAAAGGVTAAFATEVMQTAQLTYDTLVGKQWPKPDGWLGGWLKLTVADLGPPESVKGSTTSGVFGQPWIKINSQLAMGGPLKTTVAHEMGHAFQRQLTTNLVLNWIDEASAGWVAHETLGSEAQLAGDITPESEFPGVSLPGTFNTGYNDEQGYAAGAWAIWLEGAYPGAVLQIYQALAFSPLSWANAHGTLKTATGASLATLTREFALAYWGQTYAPVDALSLVTSAHMGSWKDWSGVLVAESRPPLSSQRFDVSIAATFGPSLSGHPVVVRLSGLKGSVEAWVWGDSKPCAAPANAGAMTELAVLGTLELSKSLGTWTDGTFRCLRVLIVNGSSSATAGGSARLCAPRIASVSPATGAPSGGYEVTALGSCFGGHEGSAGVTVGGFDATVKSWSDSAITFTMIDVGTSVGEWPVRVHTAEGATTQPVDILVKK